MKVLNKYVKGGTTPNYDKGGYMLTQKDVQALYSMPFIWEGMDAADWGGEPVSEKGLYNKYLTATDGGKWKITDIIGQYGRHNSNVFLTEMNGKKYLKYRGRYFQIPENTKLHEYLTPTIGQDFEDRVAEAKKRENLAKEEVVTVGPIKGGKVVEEPITIEPKNVKTVIPQDDTPVKLPPRPEPQRPQENLSTDIIEDSEINDDGIVNEEEGKPPKNENNRDYVPQTQRKDEPEYIPQTQRHEEGGTVKVNKKKGADGEDKPKKLSRFERRFKKARKKGKKTFKYRKRRLDLTEKRGVYHTGLKEDREGIPQGGTTDVDAQEEQPIPKDKTRDKVQTQTDTSQYDDGGTVDDINEANRKPKKEGNYRGGSEIPQVVRDKNIVYDRNWSWGDSDNDVDGDGDVENTEGTTKVKKTRDEKFDERQARKQQRSEDRLERKRKRAARRKYRKESRQYRRTMRRKAREERRALRGHDHVEGRRISPRRWLKNLRGKITGRWYGEGNLKGYRDFRNARTTEPVREYNMGGMAMHQDDMNTQSYENRQERKAARKERKAEKAFMQGKEGKGIRKEQKAAKATSKMGMFKDGGLSPAMQKILDEQSKKRTFKKSARYPFDKKLSTDQSVRNFLKEKTPSKEMQKYREFLKNRNIKAKTVKETNAIRNAANKILEKQIRKRPTNKQLVKMLLRKGGKSLLRKMGWLGAAYAAYEVAKKVPKSHLSTTQLKEKAKSNPKFIGRKI